MKKVSSQCHVIVIFSRITKNPKVKFQNVSTDKQFSNCICKEAAALPCLCLHCFAECISPSRATPAQKPTSKWQVGQLP